MKIVLHNVIASANPSHPLVGENVFWAGCYHIENQESFGVGANVLVGDISKGGWAITYALAHPQKYVEKSADILVNGKRCSRRKFGKMTCYVADCDGGIYAKKTAKEIINKYTRNRMKKQVRSLLAELGIDEQAESFSGCVMSESGKDIWKYSVAIGILRGKSVFLFPWFGEPMLQQMKTDIVRMGMTLAKRGCIMMLPVEHDRILQRTTLQYEQCMLTRICGKEMKRKTIHDMCLTTRDWVNFERVMVFVRSDIQDEKNGEIIGVCQKMFAKDISGDEMVERITQLKPEWGKQFLKEVSDDHKIENQEAYYLVQKCLWFVKRHLVRKEYAEAYELVDILHAYPGVVLHGDDESQQSFDDIYMSRSEIASQNHVQIFNELLMEDWHQEHENLLFLLENTCDESSVPYLGKRIETELDYMDYADRVVVMERCFELLREIGNEEAIDLIRKFEKCSDEMIADMAKVKMEQLRKGNG